MILAGDIGGTKANLALYEMEPRGGLVLIDERRYVSNDHASLELLVEDFISGRQPQIRAACFGVPGAVIDGAAKLPNLPWMVSRKQLAATLRLEGVQLINDLEATAHGVRALDATQLITLNEGTAEERGTLALIAAGTGLGQAALFRDGARYRVAASEGGHADFAPRNQLEMELLTYLLTRHQRVSYERVLSGPGLVNVYNFFKEREGAAEPAWLAEALAASDDQAQTIAAAALDEKAELCVRALDLFVTIYGAQAGNLALTFKATGGVYVGGGIAPKIIAKLGDGLFMKAFREKGRLAPLVAAIPVHIIMNPKTALLGAASYAAEHLSR
ncbi:MAG: glucokinase [Acidobacteria bacterium]|nr:glucokinase [Acidobacteriota bacterium]